MITWLWITQTWTRMYEGEFGPRWLRPYRINPCDVDCHPRLKALGKALAALGSHCKCCSGTRVLLAVLLTLAFPTVMATLLASWGVIAVVYTILGADDGNAK